MTIYTDFTGSVSPQFEPTPQLVWPNVPEMCSCPPNFNFAKTVSVTPVGTSFLRVRVAADNLSRFTPDVLHFRVVLPAAGDSNPTWPSIGANGQTEWPKGDKALHRPVYTIRGIDVEAGWLEFDAFVHEGGRVTEWAQSLRADHAEQVIGLSGPAGRGVPTASDILLAGDETAFPAIARIMAGTDRPKTGEVFLYSDVQDYDFEVPAGYTLHRVSPSHGAEHFVERFTKTPRSDDSFVWFGGEKSMTQTLRAHFHDTCGVSKDASYISAYWRRAP